MAGRINFLGHPVHPMLIVFPLGLLPAAVACDVVFLIRGGALWAHMAYWLIVGGILSGLVAAICGFADWLGLENGTRASIRAVRCRGDRRKKTRSRTLASDPAMGL